MPTTNGVEPLEILTFRIPIPRPLSDRSSISMWVNARTEAHVCGPRGPAGRPATGHGLLDGGVHGGPHPPAGVPIGRWGADDAGPPSLAIELHGNGASGSRWQGWEGTEAAAD